MPLSSCLHFCQFSLISLLLSWCPSARSSSSSPVAATPPLYASRACTNLALTQKTLAATKPLRSGWTPLPSRFMSHDCLLQLRPSLNWFASHNCLFTLLTAASSISSSHQSLLLGGSSNSFHRFDFLPKLRSTSVPSLLFSLIFDLWKLVVACGKYVIGS